MRCEKCGRKVNKRVFYPGLCTVSHKLEHGWWVCRQCLTKLQPIKIPQTLREELRPLKPRFIKVAPRSKRPVQKDWPTNRMRPDSSELQSWLEQGGNYGVVGGDGLVILDADTPQIKEVIKKHLPRTFTVLSPGSHGWHCYYLSNLERPIRLYDEDKKNVGDVQGEGKMVVGPTCIHPCGGRYTVLHDHPLAEVSEEYIREAFGSWGVSRKEVKPEQNHARRETELLDISIREVVSFAGMRKQGREYYGSHPIHGSTTGHNFWVNTSKDCWHCFRHDTGGGPLMWLAVDERIIRCEEALPGALQGDVFKKVLQAAEQRGFEVPQYLKSRPIFRGESVKVGDTRMRIPARSIKVSTEGYKVE